MWVTVLSLLMAVSVWLSVTSLAIQTNKKSGNRHCGDL